MAIYDRVNIKREITNGDELVGMRVVMLMKWARGDDISMYAPDSMGMYMMEVYDDMFNALYKQYSNNSDIDNADLWNTDRWR